MTAPGPVTGATTRLRIERLLGAADLEPDTLAPAAILVVRSLRDPLPGTLHMDTRSAAPPRAWQRAVKGALADACRNAARPARQAVPANAAAVLFADPAEMLAAFARDACTGAAASRWWWPALLRGLPGGVSWTALGALWVREARHVPAAVSQLHDTGDDVRVLASLPADQTTRVLTAVAIAFDLAVLLCVPDADTVTPHTTTPPRSAPHKSVPHTKAPHPSALRTQSTTRMRRGAVSPPAHSPSSSHPFVLPAAARQQLGAEQQALLGLCLTLYTTPLTARDSAFVAAFRDWRAAAAARYPRRRPLDTPVPPFPTVPGSVTLEPHSPEGQSLGEAAPPQSGAGPAARTTVLTAGTPAGQAPSIDSSEPPPTRAAATPRSVTLPTSHVSASSAAPAVARPLPPPEARTPYLSSVTTHTVHATQSVARTAPLPEVCSDLCGVFFLINALRAVQWFERTRDRFPSSPFATGWAWLELAARGLLTPHRFAHDAIWRVLAELDGREPGHALDAPLHNVATFMNEALPPLRARIAATLRSSDDDALTNALLLRSGRVQPTSTHVDVHLHLDDARLDVRLAGLDANPGWVPELGRVVSFHYG